MDIHTEKTGDPPTVIGGEYGLGSKYDGFQTSKMTDTAMVEEQKLEEYAYKDDRQWRVFSISKNRRRNAAKMLKAVIITQMIVQPLFSWLEHLRTTSETTSRLFDTAGDLITHCPYWISFGIIACSLAWLWRRAPIMVCSGLSLAAVSQAIVLYYYRSYHPENLTQLKAQVIALWSAFWFLYLDYVWWLGQSRLRRAARSQQNAGVADLDLSGTGKTSLKTMYQALKRPSRANDFFQRMFASRLLVAAVVLFDIVSLVYLPPDMLTDYLSTLNCEVRIEQPLSDDLFYEFTALPKSDSSFFRLSYCPEPQQWASLIREMNKHADETAAKAKAYVASKATWATDWGWDNEIDWDQPVACVAYCFLKGEDDELSAMMSHPMGPESLPEMYFCRGEHGYTGGCEETGLKLGFDVTKEGWMNDYLGSVHDSDDGPEGEPWNPDRRVHWNGEELEFPELRADEKYWIVDSGSLA